MCEGPLRWLKENGDPIRLCSLWRVLNSTQSHPLLLLISNGRRTVSVWVYISTVGGGSPLIVKLATCARNQSAGHGSRSNYRLDKIILSIINKVISLNVWVNGDFFWELHKQENHNSKYLLCIHYLVFIITSLKYPSFRNSRWVNSIFQTRSIFISAVKVCHRAQFREDMFKWVHLPLSSIEKEKMSFVALALSLRM